MEQTHVVRQTTHRVSMALEGVTEDYPTQYGGESRFRPRHLTLHWRYTPQNGWKLTEAKMTGLHVKKTGQLGVVQGTRDFEINGSLDRDAPDWLREIVTLYEPTGTVLTP